MAAVAFSDKSNEVPGNHIEVVLRQVGHQLLLSAKDSTSRVLPVKKLNENTYQVSFQNNFGFISDSLINIVEREFQKNPLAKDYIVNLRNCEEKETVLAFEINDKSGNLTPCRGRTLDVGCYIIQVDLLKSGPFNFHWLWLLLFPVGLMGFYVKDQFRKKEEEEPSIEDAPYTALGKFRFYPGDNVLKIGDQSIPLSEQETQALKIFAENTNQIVEREQLMKEIWEDKGIVVISRNVDVLVSKLRKKLSEDEAIKFINVHGRGYKFIIE